MNKKLIAAAVAAGLAMPMAASAAPTVYGKIHLNYGTVEKDYNNPATTDTDNWQVRSIASRLGFKGSEDLGGGLKANYKFEMELKSIDNGSSTTTFGDRNQYIGLKGGFGEFRIGTHDTPLKSAQGKFDAFPDGDGDIKGILGISQGESRKENSLWYSNKFGAITLTAAVYPGEETGTGTGVDDGPADQTSIALAYSAKGLYVSVANDGYDADTDGVLDTLTRVIAYYKMGNMQFGGLYETGEDKGNVGGDKDVLGLNFAMKMGKNKFKIQYMTGEEEKAAGTADTDTNTLSVGVDHALSKKTTAYFQYVTGEYDAAGTTTDYDYDSIAVGMIINF